MSKKQLIQLVCAAILIGGFYWNRSLEKNYATSIATESARIKGDLNQLQAKLDAAYTELENTPDERLAPSRLDPGQLVEQLYTLDEAPFEKVREALYCFQGLTEASTNSIPPIMEYFKTGHNDKFPFGSIASGIPMSTRRGLMEVLQEIGGMDAVALLSRVLTAAEDLSELNEIVDALMKADPDFYRPYCIQIARNTLAAITEKAEGMDPAQQARIQFDKDKIYDMLLGTLRDEKTAHELVETKAYLTKGGSLKRGILEKLSTVLGEEIVPTICDYLRDPKTSRLDMIDIICDNNPGVVLNQYVGANAEMDAVFLETLQNEDNDAFRASAVQQLTRYSNQFMRGNTEQMDPDVARGRLNLLNTIEQQYGSEPYMEGMISYARTLLEYYANPSAYEKRPDVPIYSDTDEWQRYEKAVNSYKNNVIKENNEAALQIEFDQIDP